jgi:hypothetical protein
MATVRLLIFVTVTLHGNSKYIQVYEGPENLNVCHILDFN